MEYKAYYNSPLGELVLISDETAIKGLWFKSSRNIDSEAIEKATEKETKVLKQTKKWLDIYFDGEEPDFLPELNLEGTEFQLKVWSKLLEIPYGVTTTYGEIAKEITKDSNSGACSTTYGEIAKEIARDSNSGACSTTYGEIAKEIAKDSNSGACSIVEVKSGEEKKEMVSAQAVGGAVGSNPISIILPCHRVIGSDGSLTGYGGGLNKKKKLLQIEGAYEEV